MNYENPSWLDTFIMIMALIGIWKVICMIYVGLSGLLGVVW